MSSGGTKGEGQTFDHSQLASLLAQMERLVEIAFSAGEADGKAPRLPLVDPGARDGGRGR